jgi:AraC family transcriptional regulator of adaptative response/methylated-DNA-[protein]-cysteine methyltransferase
VITVNADERQWQAIERREDAAEFVYGVATTGVYCKPACPSRRPRRDNVTVFATPADAEAAGYRSCKRCDPRGTGVAGRHAELVARACRLIEAADTTLDLSTIAAAVGLSPFHFHRVFKAVTGLTPKAYSSATRAQRTRDNLVDADRVTDAIYDSGYESSGRFYATAARQLGMKPGRFREGGADETIRFAIGECSLGSILVAATDKGICAIELADDPETVLHELQDRFPRADFIGGDSDFDALVAAVVAMIEDSGKSVELPLDIRGTAFQQRVWQALLAVPPGTTVTYGEIAQRIGSPTSARAVAAACAANPVAVAIPCHRVVRTDGSLSGYRWGIDRKRALLVREQAI